MRFTSTCFAVLCLLLTAFTSTHAEEITINENTSLRIGDFSCSPCVYHAESKLNLSKNNISAGDLWKFFAEEGQTSVKSMTLFLDLDSMDKDSNVDVRKVELKIADPNNAGAFLTSVSLGDNSLLVPANETSAFKPEAKLEFELGYDFMKIFSEHSQERVIVNFETKGNNEANAPVLFVHSNAIGFFSKCQNPILLALFIGFWIGLFHLLVRFTKPEVKTDKTLKASKTAKLDFAGGPNNAEKPSNSERPSKEAISA